MDETVRIWQATTGKELVRVSNGAVPLFSSDSKTLAIGSANPKGPVSLYEVSTGKELLQLSEDSATNLIGFSPDDRKLFVLCKSKEKSYLRLWNTKTGKQVEGFTTPKGHCLAAALCPDGKTLAVALENDGIWVCEAATGSKIRNLCPLSKRNVHDVVLAFDADGGIAAALQDESAVHIWDSATGREKHFLRGPKLMITSLAFSASGNRLVSACVAEGVFRVWDLPEGKECLVHKGLPASSAQSVVLSPDGKTVAEGTFHFGNSVRRWDVETGKEIAIPDSQHFAVGFVAFPPNGNIVTSGANSPFDTGMRFWDPSTGKQIANLDLGCLIRHAALSPDGKTAALAEWQNVIHLWDLETMKETKRFINLPGEPCMLVFTPDGNKLMATYESWFQNRRKSTLLTWDLATGKHLTEDKRWGPMVYSPDGKTYARLDGRVSLWDTASGKELGGIRVDNPHAWGPACFSPDGALLAIPSVPFQVVDVASLRCLEHVQTYSYSSHSVAFSPDGRVLACGTDDGTIELWETLTWTLADRRQGPKGYVRALAFSLDGKLLASGHEDTTTLLWDVAAFFAPGKPPQLASLWSQLGSAKGEEGLQAINSLSQVPDESIPWLAQHIKAVGTEEQPAISKLLADLDDNDFHVREKATNELAKQRLDLVPALRRRARSNPTVDVKHRVAELLGKPFTDIPDEKLVEHRRVLRAIAVLERIGTAEARKILEELARGSVHRSRTQEARAALERLAKRPG